MRKHHNLPAIEIVLLSSLSPNKCIALHFNFFHEAGNKNYWFDTRKQRRMIGHAVDSQHLCFACLHQRGDVFVQLFFMLFGKKALPAFYGKDKLQVDLGEGIVHVRRVWC